MTTMGNPVIVFEDENESWIFLYGAKNHLISMTELSGIAVYGG